MGVPLVGTIASTLVIAEVLRALHGGTRTEVLDMTLRTVESCEFVPSLNIPLAFNLDSRNRDDVLDPVVWNSVSLGSLKVLAAVDEVCIYAACNELQQKSRSNVPPVEGCGYTPKYVPKNGLYTTFLGLIAKIGPSPHSRPKLNRLSTLIGVRIEEPGATGERGVTIGTLCPKN